MSRLSRVIEAAESTSESAKAWYHVTFSDLGSTVILEPRKPVDALVWGEDKTPRISVCPTIYQCILGIAGATQSNSKEQTWKYAIEELVDYTDFYVYKLIDNTQPTVHKGNIADVHLTDEKWLLVPSKFKFVKHLRYKDLKNLSLTE